MCLLNCLYIDKEREKVRENKKEIEEKEKEIMPA